MNYCSHFSMQCEFVFFNHFRFFLQTYPLPLQCVLINKEFQNGCNKAAVHCAPPLGAPDTVHPTTPPPTPPPPTLLALKKPFWQKPVPLFLKSALLIVRPLSSCSEDHWMIHLQSPERLPFDKKIIVSSGVLADAGCRHQFSPKM